MKAFELLNRVKHVLGEVKSEDRLPGDGRFTRRVYWAGWAVLGTVALCSLPDALCVLSLAPALLCVWLLFPVRRSLRLLSFALIVASALTVFCSCLLDANTVSCCFEFGLVFVAGIMWLLIGPTTRALRVSAWVVFFLAVMQSALVWYGDVSDRCWSVFTIGNLLLVCGLSFGLLKRARSAQQAEGRSSLDWPDLFHRMVADLMPDRDREGAAVRIVVTGAVCTVVLKLLACIFSESIVVLVFVAMTVLATVGIAIGFALLFNSRKVESSVGLFGCLFSAVGTVILLFCFDDALPTVVFILVPSLLFAAAFWRLRSKFTFGMSFALLAFDIQSLLLTPSYDGKMCSDVDVIAPFCTWGAVGAVALGLILGLGVEILGWFVKAVSSVRAKIASSPKVAESCDTAEVEVSTIREVPSCGRSDLVMKRQLAVCIGLVLVIGIVLTTFNILSAYGFSKMVKQTVDSMADSMRRFGVVFSREEVKTGANAINWYSGLWIALSHLVAAYFLHVLGVIRAKLKVASADCASVRDCRVPLLYAIRVIAYVVAGLGLAIFVSACSLAPYVRHSDFETFLELAMQYSVLISGAFYSNMGLEPFHISPRLWSCVLLFAFPGYIYILAVIAKCLEDCVIFAQRLVGRSAQ